MGDGQPGLGDQAPDESGDAGDRVDAVVDEIHLSATLQFRTDRTGHDTRVEPHHVCLDRQPVLRRGLDHGHVTEPHQRHVQGPWNRRGGQRQHVDLVPKRP